MSKKALGAEVHRVPRSRFLSELFKRAPALSKMTSSFCSRSCNSVGNRRWLQFNWLQLSVAVLKAVGMTFCSRRRPNPGSPRPRPASSSTAGLGCPGAVWARLEACCPKGTKVHGRAGRVSTCTLAQSRHGCRLSPACYHDIREHQSKLMKNHQKENELATCKNLRPWAHPHPPKYPIYMSLAHKVTQSSLGTL